ncbi:transposase, partial [Mesorhizobium sp. M0622]|uniref:transposase n=1 Tax=Mesorhizobium sp. M0622 TaxID=2956975 RepID=UPI003339EA06
DLTEVKRDLAQWIAKWQAKYPKLVNWVEDNTTETLSFYRLPLAHHKQEPRWFYDRRDLTEVKRDLAQWIAKWQAKYPKLVNWVEDNIEETLSFYRLPLAHHKHMKSTNMLERLNQEIKRRTLVVRIFPNPRSCLRLVRALAVEIHENWLEATRYLNMDHLREHKKESLRALAA